MKKKGLGIFLRILSAHISKSESEIVYSINIHEYICWYHRRYFLSVPILVQYTTRCRYNAVNFRQNIHERHSSPVRARYGVSFVGPNSDWYTQFLQWYVQYPVILNRVITALDCIINWTFVNTLHQLWINIQHSSCKIIWKCRLQNCGHFVLAQCVNKALINPRVLIHVVGTCSPTSLGIFSRSVR